MEFVVIVGLSKEIANDLNHRNPTPEQPNVGLQIKGFKELNNNVQNLHDHFQSRVFISENVSAGDHYLVELPGYEPKQFTIPDDREHLDIYFNQPKNSLSKSVCDR